MAKLSKTKEYAIRYLSDNMGLNAQQISKELKLSIEDIEKILPPMKESLKEDKTKDLRISQTAVKKINSVSIMTEAASQVNDEMIKNMNTSGRNLNSVIFKPRG
jgi:hypothetical protein